MTEEARSIRIERWNEDERGKFQPQKLWSVLEERGYQISSYACSPGTVFTEHDHPYDKLCTVVEGIFCVEIGDEDIVLHPGDAVHVPRKVLHSARVIGNESTICLDAVR